jgi:hypothetical protein
MQARRLLAANTGGAKKGQSELFAAETALSRPFVSPTVIAPQRKTVRKKDDGL